MTIKHDLRKLLWRIGYDFSRFTPEFHPLARRKQIFDLYEIDTVLDIGANSGQFAQRIRDDLGYKKRIISFEPLSSAFELLKAAAERDPNWECFNIALGSVEGKRELNIAGNSYSSSLLEMLPSHRKSSPESRTIGTEVIEVMKLDFIFDDLCGPANNIFMKIDTQGFESEVLKGAENSLEHIDTVQMEMSLVRLYKGEMLFNEMYILMSELGYNLIGAETEFSNPESDQILQMNGIFHRA